MAVGEVPHLVVKAAQGELQAGCAPPHFLLVITNDPLRWYELVFGLQRDLPSTRMQAWRGSTMVAWTRV